MSDVRGRKIVRDLDRNNDDAWKTADGTRQFDELGYTENGGLKLRDIETGEGIIVYWGTVMENGEYTRFCNLDKCTQCDPRSKLYACRMRKDYEKDSGYYIY